MQDHVRLLHGRSADGCYVLASKRGPYAETMHRAREPLALSDLRPAQFVSMNRFMRRRLGSMLAAVGHAWLEFDPYAEDAQGRPLPFRGMDPAALMAILAAAIAEAGLPAPSYWTDSGRGLHAVWLCEALPGRAAPKMARIMAALYGPVLNEDGTVPARAHEDPDRDAQEARLAPMWRLFRDAGLDQGTQDAARVLRIWGSVNPRSGTRCRRLWPADIEDVRRCTVDALADAVLPLSGVAFRQRMAERAAMPATARLERPAHTRKGNPHAGRMGVWERKVADLMRLREHRGRIAVGQRHMWTFLTANAYAQAKGGTPAMWAELLAPLAGLSLAEALDCLQSLGRRQKRREAGETIEHGGTVWTPLFHYSGAKMADRLGVTEAEANAAGLNLVRPGKGKAVPAAERKAAARVRDGAVPHAARADAKLKAGRQGLALRAEGKTVTEAVEAIRASCGRGRTWAMEAMTLAASAPVEIVAVPEPSKPLEFAKEAVRFSGRYIGGKAPGPAPSPLSTPAPARIRLATGLFKVGDLRLSRHSLQRISADGTGIVVIEDRFLGLIAFDGQGNQVDVPADLADGLPRRRRAPSVARSGSRRIFRSSRPTVPAPALSADEYRRLSKGF
ncbi:hypothetical protein ASG60_08085 [Methylobacterium sp. Leaf469]|uniref:hypothetical protein n=1 Tax=Methylobacterium sp. Leaf469 TaxID=1736387 RepID=UPI0006F868A4|nr:hypothetical protein [Methylobacterium sp. Leaf469]KQT93320.1 hypothetical protein ASG60_08085 [Methylobacterium sp. Leaf469]